MRCTSPRCPLIYLPCAIAEGERNDAWCKAPAVHLTRCTRVVRWRRMVQHSISASCPAFEPAEQGGGASEEAKVRVIYHPV